MSLNFNSNGQKIIYDKKNVKNIRSETAISDFQMLSLYLYLNL